MKNDYKLNQVIIFTPVELEQEQLSEIKKRITAFTDGESYSFAVQKDENLLGGLKIQIGSKIIDLSIEGKLNELAGHKLNDEK